MSCTKNFLKSRIKMSYTVQEVSQHCTATDCWIIVDGKVLNVTSFLNDHPPGPNIILKFGGKDVTNDFKIIGHSSKAQKMFKKYIIGTVKK